MPPAADHLIWRNLTIGAPDAEADGELLDICFVDIGSFALVRDVEKHSSIVLGRTGQGKSALLLKLRSVEPNAIELRPIELAFRFVENSTVIVFFETAGVNLNLFYRLLWRHVLVTELIKRRFNLRDQGALNRWFDGLISKINRDSARAKSLFYLRQWGDNFWQETEIRLTEITKRIEEELTASLAGSALAVKLQAGSGQKLTESERAEVVSRGSSVVSKIQIVELNRVMQLLAEEAFADPQNRYYVTVDTLDEEWVSNSAKYRLIRALVEEVRTFRSELRNAKIIVALRQDLLEKVFAETRDGGFQEEKYETYYATLSWSREDLLELLRLRVNEVLKRRYTGTAVTLDDVFPRSKGGESPFEYMFDRTLARPRDVIAFANECFHVAENRPRISWAAILQAENVYSRKRKNALIDEWLNTLPSVSVALEILRGVPESITRNSFDDVAIDSVSTQLATQERGDDLIRLCRRALEPRSTVTNAQILSGILQVLYHVGAIGVKFSSESPFIWSFKDQTTISAGEAKRVISIKVHKMLWKALEIRTSSLYRAAQTED